MEPSSKPMQWSLRTALWAFVALTVVLGVTMRLPSPLRLSFVLCAGGLALMLLPVPRRVRIGAGLVLAGVLAFLPCLQVAIGLCHGQCEFRVLVRDAATRAPLSNATVVIYDRRATDLLPERYPANDPRFVPLVTLTTDSSGRALAAFEMNYTSRVGAWWTEVGGAAVWMFCAQAAAPGYKPAACHLPGTLEVACGPNRPAPPSARPLIIDLTPVTGSTSP
jgi:hypothetical protein